MNKFDEFKKAREDYPSQDNEGYVPDRGGFKCGFMEAWRIKEKELQKYKSTLEAIKLHGNNPIHNSIWINYCLDLVDEALDDSKR